jgi:hypothetical protein
MRLEGDYFGPMYLKFLLDLPDDDPLIEGEGGDDDNRALVVELGIWPSKPRSWRAH